MGQLICHYGTADLSLWASWPVTSAVTLGARRVVPADLSQKLLLCDSAGNITETWEIVPAARGCAAQLIGRRFFAIVRRFDVVSPDAPVLARGFDSPAGPLLVGISG
jgi:hypothetical protein